MLAKWKTILTNWINCYFNTPIEKQQSVTAESLLTIIEHLRENFSLDESKSSILEAHTLEEFLAEKYPDFILDRDLETEEEVYIIASLLLYFVCVTSKDVNIKNAMCSKLGAEDQEIILKFSRCLMESDTITRKHVESAVLEACGQDTASGTERRAGVAETPPALRSLHGEVRRLQAALDAERFDRNYLQEELSRSNLRIERLAKEKEECKSDILNLRAKISNCCSQECQQRPEAGGDSPAKRLLRQLDELERRLGGAREQLDEALGERDAYRNKVDELKQERDKWLSFGQQEASRATSLTEQLYTEKLNVEGLRELVAELRQHNRHNGLDGSQLECDDPDASVHSFAHNASVCSEACANVVEIQLGEERAKIIVLEQQIQTLQQQIDEVTKKGEEESLSLQKNLTDKDGDILELKHRLNEELEEKNGLKSYYNDQCMRLNNAINELEQKLKDSNDSATQALDSKTEVIKTLQEEKLSLQDIIKTHESTIQSIQSELYTERNSKQSMKEDYENRMMKLKEKVLNRNNECVELQNNVLLKSEKIEQLQCEIRKGVEERKKITNNFKQQINQLKELKAASELELAQKSENIVLLQNELKERLAASEQLSKQFNDLQDVCNNMSDQIKCLEDIRQKLTEEVRIRDENISVVSNKLETANHGWAEEVKSYREMLENNSQTICSLQAQIEAEISTKNTLQNEISQLYTARTEMADELSRLSGECEKYSQVVQDKDRMIDGLDLCLKEEKDASNKLKEECQILHDTIKKMTTKLEDNDCEIRALRDVLDNELKSRNEDNQQKQELIGKLNKEKEELVNLIGALEQAKKELINEIKARSNDISSAQEHSEQLSATINGLNSELNSLRQNANEQQTNFEELEAKYNKETSKLTNRVKETERILKDLRSKTNKIIEDKDAELLKLKHNMEAIETALTNEKLLKQDLAAELVIVAEEKEKLHNDCCELKMTIESMTSEVSAKSEELKLLQEKNEGLQLTVSGHERDRATLIQIVEELRSHEENIKEMKGQSKEFEQSMNEMVEKNNVLVQQLHETITNKDKQIYEYDQQITVARNNLNAKISELNIEHERVMKQALAVELDKYENMEHEKLVLADQLAEEQAFVEDLQAENQALATKQDGLKEALAKEESEKQAVCEERDVLTTKIEVVGEQMAKAQEEIRDLVNKNERLIQENGMSNKQYDKVIEDLKKEISALMNDKATLTQLLVEEKSTKDLLLHEKDALVAEKQTASLEKDNIMLELVKEKSVKDSLETDKSLLIEQKHALDSELKNAVETNNDLQNANTILKQNNETMKASFVTEKQKLIDELDNLNQKLVNEQTTNQGLKKNIATLISDKEHLVQKLFDEEAKLNALVQEKDSILLEKDILVKETSEEKAIRDQMENEKTTLVAKLEQECRQQSDEICVKTEELARVSAELKCFKEQCAEMQDDSNKITSTVNSALTRIIESLKKENIQNELLQKLTSAQSAHASPAEQCDLLIGIAEALQTEVAMRMNLEKALEHETSAMNEVRQLVRDKEMLVHDAQAENKALQARLDELEAEQALKAETYAASLEEQLLFNQQLQREGRARADELAQARAQLENKVHSLQEKLIDNENLTEKLKSTYECQIENLNVVSRKLTCYLKDKAAELEALRREKEALQQTVEDGNRAIKSQDEEIKSLKHGQEKLITDFESERLVLKNMVSVTESVMEDQKSGLEDVIAQQQKAKQNLESENRELKEVFESEKLKLESVIKEKDVAFDSLFKDLTEERKTKDLVVKELDKKLQCLQASIEAKAAERVTLENNMKQLIDSSEKELATLSEKYTELVGHSDSMSVLLQNKETDLQRIIIEKQQIISEKEALETQIAEKESKIQDLKSRNVELENKITLLNNKIVECTNKIDVLDIQNSDMEYNKNALEVENNKLVEKINEQESEKNTLEAEKHALEAENENLEAENNILAAENKALVANNNVLEEVKNALESEKNAVEADKLESNLKLEEIIKLQKENQDLVNIVEEKKSVITKLEQQIRSETEQNQQLRDSTSIYQNLESKCAILQDYQIKAEKHLEEREREVHGLRAQVEALESQLNDKNTIISTVSKELFEKKTAKEKVQRQLETRAGEMAEGREEVAALKRENYGLKAQHSGGQSSRSRGGRSSPRAQVDMSTSDLASSVDSEQAAADLERIVRDKNRALTALQGDVCYMKTLLAESENKLMDVTKELEVANESNQQLSAQLRKLVQQNNEEIAELKRQVSKMSVTENRASQIIKVSAKYQTIILKRIAEIKSNTVLKELTNFGNAAESELRKSVAGAVTVEDLENFLETTDRHLKRCADKQVILQKERDRLVEVNRINESEIINMKKFLTELSVSFRTFNSVKDLYTQKLSRVVAVQRTVRREVLSLDGHVTDTVMCRLERGYAAVMQDLAECVLNLERWVDRSVSRTISPEKIKQAYTSEIDRASMASGTFQNTGLEVQLEELEKSFQKLLEEVLRAHKGEAAQETQATTVMEVRAEYEDKLNRMKAKMKQLYQEQITIFREKQKEEIAALEKELLKAREKLAESSRSYEEHIRGLTTELWNVGEKFLVKQDEAEWLRRRQRARRPSLMSLQHLPETEIHDDRRESDASSLRSLPVHNTHKPEHRKPTGLHMSDEEGEVFDNRWLQELHTPRRARSPPGGPQGAQGGPQRAGRDRGERLSELRWRNSLCPPHLKSSYPAETQFAGALNEEDIKCVGAMGAGRSSTLRKEVGITAYKKPGPPTPSKQAGRLSATDSELRESLRPDAAPAGAGAGRKTTTPSRLRALFFSSKNDTNEGTPRRRLSIFRNKK